MPLIQLDHVNIRTTRLDAMVEWYSRVLDLKRGTRPDFPFNGAWMYLGDQPVVHIVEYKDMTLVGSEVDLKLEHMAFAGEGLSDFLAKLDRLGIKYKRVDIPLSDLIQVNIWDADGNHLHVDFKFAELSN